MGDQFQAVPETLREGGQAIYEIATRVADEWQRFSATVKGMGDIFGDDPVGSLIGTSHQAAHGVAERCLNSVATGFGGFGRGLGKMADSIEDTEQANTGHFNRIQRAI
jgi:hypothetical protein